MEPISSSQFVRLFLALFAFKAILIPGYYSTDYEVHRQWMGLTRHYSVSDWYLVSAEETGAQWTLDYPPLFALLERGLAEIASRVVDAKYDPVGVLRRAEMEEPSQDLGDRKQRVSDPLLLFMRLTVMIISDGFYAVGLFRCLRVLSTRYSVGELQMMTLLGFGALVIVDNLHFQYNGLAIGLILLAVERLAQRSFVMFGALLAISLNVKHTLLYYCPGLGVWILTTTRLVDCLNISAGFVPITLLLVAPFWSQRMALLRRLFPFGRGLFHAYWAPNAWALYSVADKALSRLLGMSLKISSNTRGLVGVESTFEVLPAIRPSISAVCTVSLTAAPLVVYTLNRGFRPDKMDTVSRMSDLCLFAGYSALTAFLFGWHVHEKALLLPVIPLILSDSCRNEVLSPYISTLLTLSTNIAVLPLLHEAPEFPLKFYLCWGHFLLLVLSNKPALAWASRRRMLVLVAGLVALAVSLLAGDGGLFHLFFRDSRLKFLPLMLTSSSCAIGVAVAWLVLVRNLLSSRPKGKIS